MAEMIGAGTVLVFDSVTIGKVTSITAPKLTVTKVPVDTFDAPVINGLPYEDSMPGWATPGAWTFKIFYVVGGSAYHIMRGKVGKTLKTGTVTYPDGSVQAFTGYITEIGEEVPLKEGMTYDVTIQVCSVSADSFTAIS